MRACLVLLLFVGSCADPSLSKGTPPAARIQRPQIEEMFDSMRGEPGWDLDSDLVWDYFFTDDSESRLTDAAPLLVAMGYDVIGIFAPAPEDDDQTTLVLRIRKTEHHTVDSLLKRNAEFYDFAEENALGSYDGMDMSRPEDFYQAEATDRPLADG